MAGPILMAPSSTTLQRSRQHLRPIIPRHPAGTNEPHRGRLANTVTNILEDPNLAALLSDETEAPK